VIVLSAALLAATLATLLFLALRLRPRP
jgi:hypothetical protein